MADNIMGLPSGFRLQDYEVESVLASSESSIKYLAVDRAQQRRVAIEEFLPGFLAVRDSTHAVVSTSSLAESSFNELLEQFLDEAAALKGWRHPQIVEIHRSFRANGTGYLVMDYVEGQTLSEILRKVHTVPEGPLHALLHPLLDCLESMHDAGLQHQHILPGNIVLDGDGSPRLLARGLVTQGFSAARQAFGDRTRNRRVSSNSVYAPLEMYSSSAITGPWTDIYALGATLYHCVTGAAPPAAPDRMIADSVPSAREAAQDTYPEGLLAGIDAALATRPTDRPRSIAVWRDVLSGKAPGKHAHRLHSDLKRTAARASPPPATDASPVIAAVAQRPTWVVPALALTAVTVLIAYLDTGILRSTGEDSVEPLSVAGGRHCRRRRHSNDRRSGYALTDHSESGRRKPGIRRSGCRRRSAGRSGGWPNNGRRRVGAATRGQGSGRHRADSNRNANRH